MCLTGFHKNNITPAFANQNTTLTLLGTETFAITFKKRVLFFQTLEFADIWCC